MISGPLSDFSGEIAEINEDAAKLKVLVSIFGRETPVEVGYDQVKKIYDGQESPHPDQAPDPGGAGQSPAPPVGPALGQHGVNIMEFCKAFNAQTQQDAGTIIPVEITVFEDRSFTFITKTPPAAVLIKQAIGIEKGSGEPNRDKVGTITQDQVRQIAEKKLPDLNANDVDQAAKIIEGTARSMGVEVVGVMAKHGKRYREPREQVDREREYTPAEASGSSRTCKRAKFDETVEVHIRTRAQRPPRRPAAARHDRAAARPRQGRHDRRLRPGRQGARGRGGRRRLRRRRGPRRARPGAASPTSTSRSRRPT